MTSRSPDATACQAPSRHIVLFIRRIAARSGGAERVYCELANLLVEAGYRVTCLHFEWSRQAPAYPLNERVERVNLWRRSRFNPGWPAALRSLSLGYRKGRLWSPIAWLSKHGPVVTELALWFRRERPDAVIALLPNAITPALLAGRLTHTPVVASHHNAPERDYASDEKYDQNPLDKRIRLPLLHTAARMHVLLEDYRAWFPPEMQGKVEVIHNYPSIEAPLSPPSKEKLVIGVGRLTQVKNYRVLLQAWSQIRSQFPDWRVEIYGSGEEESLLRDESATLALGDSLRLMGTTENMAELYARASVLAHPAIYEGFPLSVVEALHLGVPVLAFAGTSGVSQLVRSGHNGLLVDRDRGVDALARGLARLLENEGERLEWAAAAPSSVAQYSKEAYLSRWKALLESIAAPSKTD